MDKTCFVGGSSSVASIAALPFIYTSQRQCFHHSTDTFPVITESSQQAPSLYIFESQFWAPFTINLSEGGIGRFGLVTVFVIALQALTSVAAFRDGGICRFFRCSSSPLMTRPALLSGLSAGERLRCCPWSTNAPSL